MFTIHKSAQKSIPYAVLAYWAGLQDHFATSKPLDPTTVTGFQHSARVGIARTWTDPAIRGTLALFGIYPVNQRA
jgi:hypothetical protein